MTILVADDSPVTRLTIAHILVGAGYQVDAVENGKDALQRLRQTPIDLLFSDVRMPGMSGLELVTAVRQERDLQHLPIILVTGSGEQLDQARESRADDILIKPVSSWKVLECTARWLGDRR